MRVRTHIRAGVAGPDIDRLVSNWVKEVTRSRPRPRVARHGQPSRSIKDFGS